MSQTQPKLRTIHEDKPHPAEVLQTLIDIARKFLTFLLEYYEGIFCLFVKLYASREGIRDGSALVKCLIGFHSTYGNR